MYMASGLTRWGSVPAILLFLRNPAHADARIIYIEDEIAAPPGAVFAAFEAQLAGDGAVLAHETERLLTVQFAMPADLPKLAGHRTVLTLTFEPKGEGTRLTLTHAGFGKGAAWDEGLGWFTRAWPAVVTQMKAVLEAATERLAA
jgi:uncharacterized protein YndB with AHSA1/START domain